MKGKQFSFHAKRGQHDQVIGLLSQYGKVEHANTGKGVMIYVTLPEGVSKRSVDKMLYDAAVPGASRRKKKTPIVSIPGLSVFDGEINPHFTVSQADLEQLYERGLCYRPILVSVKKRFYKIFIEWCLDCWIIRRWDALSPVQQRHYRTVAREGRFVIAQ
jgi:hypothetical protein